jgi:ribosomal protein S18 acetylase RimI-like enzyme
MMIVRPSLHGDIPALQQVLHATALFPAEMLPNLMQGFLSGDADETWFTSEMDGTPTGFCFAKAEELTDRTWNLKAIAVQPSLQRTGQGRALVAGLEAALKANAQRILIVDTSSTDDFLPTRAFYQALSYTEQARIKDFWADGDDKVVFWKALN